MALFGGAYFGSRVAALAVPLLAMLMSDAVFALTAGWALGWMTVVIYSCIAISVRLGMHMQSRIRVSTVIASSFLSALIFFVVTNFAVWAGTGYYPKTAGGLLECYASALPFFGNTLAGHAVYTLALFGGFSVLQRRFGSLSPDATPLAI